MSKYSGSWEVDGELGFTTQHARRRHLVDEVLDEPVEETLTQVIWSDPEGEEHTVNCGPATVQELQDVIKADETGKAQILRTDVIAERVPLHRVEIPAYII